MTNDTVHRPVVWSRYGWNRLPPLWHWQRQISIYQEHLFIVELIATIDPSWSVIRVFKLAPLTRIPVCWFVQTTIEGTQITYLQTTFRRWWGWLPSHLWCTTIWKLPRCCQQSVVLHPFEVNFLKRRTPCERFFSNKIRGTIGLLLTHFSNFRGRTEGGEQKENHFFVFCFLSWQRPPTVIERWSHLHHSIKQGGLQQTLVEALYPLFPLFRYNK